MFARDRVHRGSAGEQLVDLDALERGGQQTDGAEGRGAATDPVPHRETGEPAFLLCDEVKLGALTGNGDELFRVVEPRRLERSLRLEHAVARFRGAAGLGDDDDQSLLKARPELLKHAVHAVRVSVVEEGHPQLVAAALEPAEGVGDKLRSKRRTTDADDKDFLELARRAHDLALMHLGGEGLDGFQRGGDGGAEFGIGRQFGCAQPIVADHAVLVGVGDGAGLECRHVGERLLQLRLQRGRKIIRERHAADVERQTELGVGVVERLEAVPGHRRREIAGSGHGG